MTQFAALREQDASQIPSKRQVRGIFSAHAGFARLASEAQFGLSPSFLGTNTNQRIPYGSRIRLRLNGNIQKFHAQYDSLKHNWGLQRSWDALMNVLDIQDRTMSSVEVSTASPTSSPTSPTYTSDTAVSSGDYVIDINNFSGSQDGKSHEKSDFKQSG
jgi:hypothetical protein